MVENVEHVICYCIDIILLLQKETNYMQTKMEDAKYVILALSYLGQGLIASVLLLTTVILMAALEAYYVILAIVLLGSFATMLYSFIELFSISTKIEENKDA